MSTPETAKSKRNKRDENGGTPDDIDMSETEAEAKAKAKTKTEAEAAPKTKAQAEAAPTDDDDKAEQEEELEMQDATHSGDERAVAPVKQPGGFGRFIRSVFSHVAFAGIVFASAGYFGYLNNHKIMQDVGDTVCSTKMLGGYMSKPGDAAKNLAAAGHKTGASTGVPVARSNHAATRSNTAGVVGAAPLPHSLPAGGTPATIDITALSRRNMAAMPPAAPVQAAPSHQLAPATNAAPAPPALATQEAPAAAAAPETTAEPPAQQITAAPAAPPPAPTPVQAVSPTQEATHPAPSAQVMAPTAEPAQPVQPATIAQPIEPPQVTRPTPAPPAVQPALSPNPITAQTPARASTPRAGQQLALQSPPQNPAAISAAPAAIAPAAATAPKAAATAPTAPAATTPKAAATAPAAPAATTPKAAATAPAAPAQNTATLADAWKLARQAYASGRPGSDETYKKLIKRFPDVPDLPGELGNIYYQQGKLPQAAEQYYEAAMRLLQRNQPAQAACLLDVLARIDPARAAALSRQTDRRCPPRR